MEDKRNLFLDINEDLLLSYSNTNILKQDNRKSMNLINNIKSLSILSNNKILQSSKKKKDSNNNKYRPVKTEDNIKSTKISAFKNIIMKSVKCKPLKKGEIKIKRNKINRTTASNTNDKSNTKPNSNFNTNNNSKISNNLNSTNSVYTKKVYSQNLLIYNKDNNISNINKNRIPVANRYIQSFGEISNDLLDKNKFLEKNNKILTNIKKTKIKNIYNNNDKNDSDDDGIINKVKNFGDNHEFNLKENKENIDTNKKIENADINDNSNITSRSNHSYSVIESIEIIPSMNKNNIFSNAHKKYFS